MALFGEKKPPEEKKPEETINVSSNDELLAKMGELLNPLSESQKQINNRLQALEERTKPKETQPPREMPSVLDNEDAAFNNRLEPIAAETVKANARMTEREVLDDVIAEGWNEYIQAIKSEFANTPIQVKAMPTYETYCRNVVDMVVGREARKGGMRRKAGSFILESADSTKNGDGSDSVGEADREFLNYEVVTSKGKRVKRSEFLTRMGINISDPKVLKEVQDNWAKVQVIN